MTEQATIERAALANVNYARAVLEREPVQSLDGFIPVIRAEYIKHTAAILSALRPGDVLPNGLVVEQGWQTMDTAPKDGTIILLCHATNGFPTVSGYWGLAQSAHKAGVADKKHPWVILENTNGCNAWSNDPVHGPTHWRPLPAPPKGGE